MRRSLISLGFFFSIMLFVSAPALAASSTATEQKAPVGTAVVRTKPAPLIDINSASTATLQTLPGISKAQAERIVAGRPYGSKAWLVSEKRLDDATYQGIKSRVVAKQPFKDGAKNAALYKDRKPPSEAK